MATASRNPRQAFIPRQPLPFPSAWKPGLTSPAQVKTLVNTGENIADLLRAQQSDFQNLISRLHAELPSGAKGILDLVHNGQQWFFLDTSINASKDTSSAKQFDAVFLALASLEPHLISRACELCEHVFVAVSTTEAIEKTLAVVPQATWRVLPQNGYSVLYFRIP